ncbi:type II toxin-antitoxin system RelE/ParE family toxin [Flavobacterium sp.]|uniref:type II toxin-antitoxin system RelE/ParE family toxin n=1 Tax=Flavobacterium sp. TaxID=239 RepID=UPI00286E5FF9|nr:type II toxin-antitoxin system RelE/ParE family toxin [Flavobacterium sp.]
MEYFIEISEEAKANIEEALNYYSVISTSLKDRFEAELSKSIDLLSKNPLQHQIRYRKIRIAFTSVFPYGIHYIVENEYVYIFNILHTKRFFK